MPRHDPALVLGALEKNVSDYVQEGRHKIAEFSDKYFTLPSTFEIQKKTFAIDVFINPVNTFWSVPYLTLKKVTETLEQLGWTKMTPYFEMLPSGIKTAYQRHVEKLLQKQVLDFGGKNSSRDSGLFKRLQNDAVLGPLLDSNALGITNSKINALLDKEVQKYTANQAMITDLASTLITFVSAWWFFGDKNLNLSGMSHRIANKWAHDKAASNFIFGKKAGSTFYNLFPPQPTSKDIVIATVLIGGLTMAVSLLASLFMDPVRNKLGLHEKKLHMLMDKIEENLFIQLKKEIKSSLGHAKSHAS